MRWSTARWRASAPSSRRIAARCCSTPATTCSPPSAPTKSAKTTPSARCAAASPCWPRGRPSARRCRQRMATPASASVSASTPAASCSAAASTAKAASAASPSTSPRGWSRPRRPGALRISNDTHALVRDRFEVVAQEPMAVKGVDAPIRSWLVQRAVPSTHGRRGARHRRRGDAHGRPRRPSSRRSSRCSARSRPSAGSPSSPSSPRPASARAGCSTKWRARPTSKPSAGRSCTAGRGRRPRASPTDCCARSSPDRSASATTTAWSVPGRRSSGAWCRCSPTTGAELAQAHAHLLGHLIGLDFGDSPHIRDIRDEGRQIRRRGFHAAAQALRRIAARDGKPVVLLLDDLHWADDGSLDFLSQLVEANADVPTLVLGTARPALLERRPDVAGRTRGASPGARPARPGRKPFARRRAAEEARGGAAGAARAPHPEAPRAIPSTWKS